MGCLVMMLLYLDARQKNCVDYSYTHSAATLIDRNVYYKTVDKTPVFDFNQTGSITSKLSTFQSTTLTVSIQLRLSPTLNGQLFSINNFFLAGVFHNTETDGYHISFFVEQNGAMREFSVVTYESGLTHYVVSFHAGQGLKVYENGRLMLETFFEKPVTLLTGETVFFDEFTGEVAELKVFDEYYTPADLIVFQPQEVQKTYIETLLERKIGQDREGELLPTRYDEGHTFPQVSIEGFTFYRNSVLRQNNLLIDHTRDADTCRLSVNYHQVLSISGKHDQHRTLPTPITLADNYVGLSNTALDFLRKDFFGAVIYKTMQGRRQVETLSLSYNEQDHCYRHQLQHTPDITQAIRIEAVDYYSKDIGFMIFHKERDHLQRILVDRKNEAIYSPVDVTVYSPVETDTSILPDRCYVDYTEDPLPQTIQVNLLGFFKDRYSVQVLPISRNGYKMILNTDIYHNGTRQIEKAITHIERSYSIPYTPVKKEIPIAAGLLSSGFSLNCPGILYRKIGSDKHYLATLPGVTTPELAPTTLTGYTININGLDDYTPSTEYTHRKTGPISVLPDKTYCINSFIAPNIRVFEYNNMGEYVNRSYLGDKTLRFTTSPTTRYLRVTLWTNGSSLTSHNSTHLYLSIKENPHVYQYTSMGEEYVDVAEYVTVRAVVFTQLESGQYVSCGENTVLFTPDILADTAEYEVYSTSNAIPISFQSI